MTDHILSAASSADVATAKASSYLQQLCKHFGHKIPAEFDETSGHLTFPFGEARLTAGDGVLHMALTAPDAARLDQLQDVVARHLVRFAFREELVVDWKAA